MIQLDSMNEFDTVTTWTFTASTLFMKTKKIKQPSSRVKIGF